jgi:dienelactone hydrolase
MEEHTHIADDCIDSGRREFLFAGAGLLLPIRLAQVLPLLRCGTDHRHDGTPLNDLSTFDERPKWFTAFGKPHTMYVGGSATAPPVLVLHELPGMTREDMDFAYRLSQRGFRVYLPLLFGKKGDNKFVAHFWGECVFGPWPWEDKHSLNKWVAPLLTVCDQIYSELKQPIGVVGMCLTGIIPLSLLANEHVVAPVLCQPTLPFPMDGGRKRALGLTGDEIAHAKDRMTRQNLSGLAFRVTTDCFCPRERFNTLRDMFGDRIERREIVYPPKIRGHSVLAAEFHNATPPVDARTAVHEAFDHTVAFLKAALGG